MRGTSPRDGAYALPRAGASYQQAVAMGYAVWIYASQKDRNTPERRKRL